MAVPFYKLIHTPRYSNESTDITNLVSLTDKHAIKTEGGNLSFEIVHPLFKYVGEDELTISEGDSLSFYLDNSPIDTSDNTQRIMEAEVIKTGQKLGRKNVISVECKDKSRLMLDYLWANSYEDKVDNIVRNVTQQASQSFAGTEQITTNNVVSTTSDGSAFPTVTIAKIYKTVFEWIEELAQPEHTGDDKAYLFYVDKDNDLHFEYPETTTSTTLDVSQIDLLDEMSVEKGDFDIINMVIFNAGDDKNGNGVLWYYYDVTSESSELKMKYIPMTDISRDFQKDFPSQYAAFSNDDYRTYLKNQGIARSQRITNQASEQTYQIKIPMKGTTSYAAGDLIEVTVPKHGIISKKMRIKSVIQNVNSQGWRTTLTLVEDEKSLAESA